MRGTWVATSQLEYLAHSPCSPRDQPVDGGTVRSGRDSVTLEDPGCKENRLETTVCCSFYIATLTESPLQNNSVHPQPFHEPQNRILEETEYLFWTYNFVLLSTVIPVPVSLPPNYNVLQVKLQSFLQLQELTVCSKFCRLMFIYSIFLNVHLSLFKRKWVSEWVCHPCVISGSQRRIWQFICSLANG